MDKETQRQMETETRETQKEKQGETVRERERDRWIYTQGDSQTDKQTRDRERQILRQTERDREQNGKIQRETRDCARGQAALPTQQGRKRQKHRDLGTVRRVAEVREALQETGGKGQSGQGVKETRTEDRSHATHRRRGCESPVIRRGRGEGSQQGRVWPCVVCCGSSACVPGRVLCVHLPRTDSRLGYMPALAPGTTSPGTSTALPSSQELRLIFLWRQRKMSILKSSSKSGLRCTFAWAPDGVGEGSSRAPSALCQQQLEGCTLRGYKYLPECSRAEGWGREGVSEFGREQAFPLRQQQTTHIGGR